MKKDKIKQLIKRLKTEYIIFNSDISCWYNEILNIFIFKIDNNFQVYLENAELIGNYKLLPKNSQMYINESKRLLRQKRLIRQKKLERILL